MRRREFISLLGGAAAWPLTASAQHADRVRNVVFLHGLAENDPEVQARVEAFRQGLETLGWTQDRNIRIEHRFSEGDLARIQAYTAELVRSAPDVIVASSTPVIAALKQATATIPIVFSESTIHLDRASSRVWRVRAATSLGSLLSSSPWWASGWSCSKRSPPA